MPISAMYFEMYQRNKKDGWIEGFFEKVCDEADTAKCQQQNLGGDYVGVSCAGRINETAERKLPSQQRELAGSLR